MSQIDPRFYTAVVHAGAEPEATVGAVMPPIFLSSTFAQEEPGKFKRYDYSRAGNPSRGAYEDALAALESAKAGFAFASGLAAEQAVVQLADPGTRVLVCDDVYGGTGRLFRRFYAKYGIDFQFVDMTDARAVSDILAKRGDKPCKLVWIETPTNPMMKIVDIRAVAAAARAAGALTVVDNTFATPAFQSPLALGADIVVHSTTKYIGGHSDLIGGAVMVNDPTLAEHFRFAQLATGGVQSPFDSYLAHRSIKTLAVRMAQHDRNARGVAEFLTTHKRIAAVYFPGLPSHPQHALAREQMRGYSGMVSFDVKGTYDDVVRFTRKLKLVALAESLGGVESLINHPEKMTHASVPEDLRRQLGIGPTLLRLSCGIEATEDIIADVQQALD